MKTIVFYLFFLFLFSGILYAEDYVLTVAVDSGFQSMQMNEIVYSKPGYKSPYLSYLKWKTPGVYAGVLLSYKPWEVLRLNGSFRYKVHSENGNLENLDYTDSQSSNFTHRSLSPFRVYGFNWNFSADFLVIKKLNFILFVRAGYLGYYYVQEAYGGEYVYPTRSGTFSNDVRTIRYRVVSHIPYAGMGVELPFPKSIFYIKGGINFSYFPFLNDRDNHLLRETDFYNSYRLGAYLQFELVLGINIRKNLAVELYYEPSFQFQFQQTDTQIRTPFRTYRPEEKSNYSSYSHRIGLRVSWSFFRLVNP